MITAIYKGKEVAGRWFMLGDAKYLLLTPESEKITGVSAILEEHLEVV